MSETKTGAGEFCQQVRMAAVQVAGLRPEELAQALAYEVEPMSGIPASEAEVTYQPVIDPDPTVRVYDVVVKRRARKGETSAGLDRWLRPAFIFAAIVILVIIGDCVWILAHRLSLEKTVAERRPLQSELNRLQSETQAARASAEAIRKRREESIQAQDSAAAMRVEHAELLTDIASACRQGTVVKNISRGEESRSLRIQAIDVSGEAAAKAMQKLSTKVAKNGWQLLPGEIVKSGTGATVSFTFELTRTR